jgi:hypothetical protein
MSDDIVELNGLDIKTYISSQRNCRAAATGYVMEPLNSNLIIDLSSFSGNIKASIFSSRLSGNGRLKINNVFTDVLSKTSHQVDLDIIDNKKIEISRGQDSVGKIIINSIKIINIAGIDTKLATTQFNQPQMTLKESVQSWQHLLLKAGNVRGIKLINERLYASEGAQIQHANIIESLETDPPQSFVISNIIKFVFACEIKSVYFKDEFNDNVYSNASKYKHFMQPPVIKSNLLISTNNTINKLSNTVSNMTSSQNNNVIYDSFISSFPLANSKEAVAGQGKNGNGVLLKREGGFSIPITGLKPSMQYVIVANLKKISGNGKFGVAITTTNGEARSSTIVIAPDRETEMYIKLNTEDPPSIGNSYALKIFRPEDSTVGDVLLERLMIIQGITLASPHVSTQPTSINKSNPASKTNKTTDIDGVRATSKQYSRKIDHTKTEPKFNYTGNIAIKNNSAVNWVNKIKPLCPNLSMNDNANIVFGELGSLSHGEKIWIDPFNDDFISEKDNSILSKAKVLISPSLQNTELFQKLYPNAEIHHLERPWPLIETTPMSYPSSDYVVMIHRTKEITDRIIESYSKDNPSLVMIGALESYPEFVIPMNEHIVYDKMLGVLLNSKLLIDVSPVDDYKSAILSIAFDSGLPVITSNWFGLGKNNCKFIVAKDKSGNINIPKIKDLEMGIEDGLKLNKIEATENHNAKLDKFFSVIFK